MPLTLRSWGRRSTFALILGFVSLPSIRGERATRIEDIVRLAELRENLTGAQNTAGISTEHEVDAHEAAVSSAALVVDGSARFNARISAAGVTEASANDSRHEAQSLHSGGAKAEEQHAQFIQSTAALTQSSSDISKSVSEMAAASRSRQEVHSLLSGGAETVEKSAESIHATNTATSVSRLAEHASANRSFQEVQSSQGTVANTAEQSAESIHANSTAAGRLTEKVTHSHQEVQSLHSSGAKTPDQSAESTQASSTAVGGLVEKASAMAQSSETIKAHAQATESLSDTLASSLTAARVQAHEALLAEQKERSDLHRQHGSRAGGDVASERKEEPTPSPEQKSVEENAKKEEESTFSKGLGTLSKAFTDPRGFLIELPGMKEFAAGIKAAIDLGPDKGKCLASGEFAGFGCGDSKDFPKMCSCSRMFEMCYLPDDPKLTVDKMTKGQTKEAFEEAKTLLFGKCYRSMTIMFIVGVVALVGIFFVCMTLKKVFAKSRPS